MASLKISNFVVAMIIASLMITGFTLLMGEFNTKYPRSDYDNTTFNALDQTDELVDYSNEMRNSTNLEVDPSTSQFDLLGGWFGSAIGALKTSVKSVDIFLNMTDEAAEQSGIDNAKVITTSLISALLILIFIGIFVSYVGKKDL